jgi:hypothetical protein
MHIATRVLLRNGQGNGQTNGQHSSCRAFHLEDERWILRRHALTIAANTGLAPNAMKAYTAGVQNFEPLQNFKPCLPAFYSPFTIANDLSTWSVGEM